MRENVATKTIYPCQRSGKNNVSDLLTKPLERNSFMQHPGKLLSLSTFDDNGMVGNSILKRSISWGGSDKGRLAYMWDRGVLYYKNPKYGSI